VISGEANFATVGDTPFAMAAIKGKPVAVPPFAKSTGPS
jgi:ABC-type nitrate/sulfonate/bicarbonate transport system substrate-binding protein